MTGPRWTPMPTRVPDGCDNCSTTGGDPTSDGRRRRWRRSPMPATSAPASTTSIDTDADTRARRLRQLFGRRRHQIRSRPTPTVMEPAMLAIVCPGFGRRASSMPTATRVPDACDVCPGFGRRPRRRGCRHGLPDGCDNCPVTGDDPTSDGRGRRHESAMLATCVPALMTTLVDVDGDTRARRLRRVSGRIRRQRGCRRGHVYRTAVTSVRLDSMTSIDGDADTRTRWMR